MLSSLVTGALSGAANAELSGGNPWKGALYGGLTSAAITGTVKGVTILGAAVIGEINSNTPSKDSGLTGKLYADGYGGVSLTDIGKGEGNELPPNYNPQYDPGFPDADAYREATRPPTPGEVKALGTFIAGGGVYIALIGGPVGKAIGLVAVFIGTTIRAYAKELGTEPAEQYRPCRLF